jgi:hypothetical protein
MVDILERAGMSDCKPCSTSVDTCVKLTSDGTLVSDVTQYHGIAGALRYLTLTHLNIAYAVQQVYLYMHDPLEPRLTLVKRILRRIQGTLDYSLHLYCSSVIDLIAYSIADWVSCPNTRRVGCPDTRHSTSGYGIFLDDNLVSWSSKWQHTISHSSAKTKYRGVANVIAEASWLCQLLEELHSPPHRATIVYYDNISVVYLSTNPVQHQRTKHIEIDLHFVHDKVAAGAIRVLHVPTTAQYEDVFTKGLPSSVFVEFHSSLNVLPCG